MALLPPASANRPRLHAGVLACGLLAALLGHRAASAGEPEIALARQKEAERLVRRGVELRRLGQDEAAIELFRSALALHSTPRIEAQLGLCAQAIGRWVEAERHVRTALRKGRGDPWIARNRRAIEGALRVVEQHLGSIALEGNVAGAEVRVDGERVGVLPLAQPLRVAAGPVTVSVSAPGYHTAQRRFNVAVQAIVAWRAELSPLVSERLGPPPRPTLERPYRRNGWAAAAAAMALAGVGAAGLGVREKAVQEFNDPTCLTLHPGQTRAMNCPDALHRVDLGRTLAIAGFASGGAMAVAAGVLLFYRRPSSPLERSARAVGSERGWRCAQGPGQIGVFCATRF